MKKLADKVALITGVGSGLGGGGRASAAHEGAKVGLLSRSEDELAQLAKEITQAGGEALPMRANVAKADEVNAAFDGMSLSLEVSTGPDYDAADDQSICGSSHRGRRAEVNRLFPAT